MVHNYSTDYCQPAWAVNPAPANIEGRTLPPTPFYSYPEFRGNIVTCCGKVDLESKGVCKFTDKPGAEYMLWKHLFVHAIRGERVDAATEIGLMLKWLGPQSRDVVASIYTSQLYEPVNALKQSWAALDQQFGAPTMTESSFLEQIDNFPAMTLNNPQELWNFSRLLAQLRSAKMDPTLPGLACLDLHMTLKNVVRKLPKTLISEWYKISADYRGKNFGKEPPFDAFVEFVARMAKNYNDPHYIDYMAKETYPIRKTNQSHGPTKGLAQAARGAASVSVHSTEVVPLSTENSDVKPSKNAKEEPVCPLHKTSHTLNECRGFRKKSLDERKALIKEFKICFKCCESTDHVAKTCTVKVICYLCKSDKHPTALHLDRKSTPRATNESQNDSETHPEPTTIVNCTSVCGDSPSPRSCHPICLAKVYPAGRPEEAVKMYVIVDAQSNQSLAKSAFFDHFDIQSKATHFTMSTCMGVQRTAGRKAAGFCIESLDGNVKFTLPPLLECDALPDNRKQIATPDVVSNIPHLRHMANLFPALDPEAEILLLLGADAPEAFPPQAVVKGPAGSPCAFKTELGWSIIGPVCIDRLREPP